MKFMPKLFFSSVVFVTMFTSTIALALGPDVTDTPQPSPTTTDAGSPATSIQELIQINSDCVRSGATTSTPGCSEGEIRARERLIAQMQHQAQNPTIDCSKAQNRGWCSGAKAYEFASGKATTMMSAYTQATTQQDLNRIQGQYAQGSSNMVQTRMDAMKVAEENANQAANRNMAVAGAGMTVAAANYRASIAAKKAMKDCDKHTDEKARNTCLATHGQKMKANADAAQAALVASVAPTMLMLQDRQTADAFAKDRENLKNWAATNQGTNTFNQYEGGQMLNPYDRPTDPNDPANNNFDPNILGTGIAGAPPGTLDTNAPGNVWVPSSAPGGGGGGGYSFGGGGMPSSSAPAPFNPMPMDPNAGKPTYANIDESGGGYRAGYGGAPNGGRPLDLNSALAQYLPQSGDKVLNENGFEKLGDTTRAIASESNSLLDANVNIFERISETYSRKAKSGEIKL